MKSKSDKRKTTDKNEERFYHFARALMAVPKKELDKDLHKSASKKSKQRNR